MKKLLPIALLFISCDLMSILPDKGDPYLISDKEASVIIDIFGKDGLDWANENVFWGDIGDSLGRYHTSGNFILMSEKVSQTYHGAQLVIIHELVHKYQFERDGCFSKGSYEFTINDIKFYKLNSEQEAEVVRIYAMLIYYYPSWKNRTTTIFGPKTELTPTLASYLYNVLDKLGLKDYKRPTF